jgi:hypothetical protein
MNLETAINPELYWEARRVNKRSPVNISIKVFVSITFIFNKIIRGLSQNKSLIKL